MQANGQQSCTELDEGDYVDDKSVSLLSNIERNASKWPAKLHGTGCQAHGAHRHKPQDHHPSPSTTTTTTTIVISHQNPKILFLLTKNLESFRPNLSLSVRLQHNSIHNAPRSS